MDLTVTGSVDWNTTEHGVVMSGGEIGTAGSAHKVIDVFNINSVEFEEKADDGEQFIVTFSRTGDSFREYYYLTPKAAGRFKYIFESIFQPIFISL